MKKKNGDTECEIREAGFCLEECKAVFTVTAIQNHWQLPSSVQFN